MKVTKEIAQVFSHPSHARFFLPLLEEVEVGMEVPVRLTKCVWLDCFTVSVPGQDLTGKRTKNTITFLEEPYVSQNGESVLLRVRSSSGHVGVMDTVMLQHLKLVYAPGAYPHSGPRAPKRNKK